MRQARGCLRNHEHYRLPGAESLDHQPGDPLLLSEGVRFPLRPRQRQDHDAVALADQVRFRTQNQPGRVDEVNVEEPQGAGLEQVTARHERCLRRLALKHRRHGEVVRQLPPDPKDQIVEIQIAAFPDLERIAELTEDENRLLLEAPQRALRLAAIVHACRHNFRRRAKADLIAEHP